MSVRQDLIDAIVRAGIFVSGAGTIADAIIAASVAGASTAAVNVFTRNQSVSPVVLTDGSSVPTDASQSTNFYLTLTASGHTMAAPTNATNGMVCNWTINSGAGSFTFSWNAVFDFGGAGAPVHSTVANKEDLVSAIYSSSTGKWLAAFRKGS